MKNKNEKLFQTKSKILQFLFLQVYISFIYCSNYISMKLSNYNNEIIKKIPDVSFNYQYFINNTIENYIYTTISIGNPIQYVKTWIDTDEFSYFLYKDTCILESFYYEDNSITYKPDTSKTYSYKGYGEAIFINESFIFKNSVDNNDKEIKLNQFPILFMPDPKNDKRFNDMHSPEEITNKTCATIGFRYISNYNDKTSKDFIEALKEKEIIDDYIIFIEYDRNGNEQNLIIGGYPEEVFQNKYNIKNQQTTYIKFYYQYINQWGLNFDKIYSDEDYKFYDLDVAFHYNLGVIYGVKSYQSYIESQYYNNYIKLNMCEKVKYRDYESYICDKDKFSINDMKKFPKLNFIKAELEETFVLTYEDLFFIKGDKVYFLVVFHHLLKEVWELGKPFLKKYSFAFNFDSKLIWYYKKEKNNNQKNNNKKREESFLSIKIFFICGILVLSIILGILSFLLGRMIYNNKKKLIKAEELDQDFDYENYEKEIN